MFFSFVVGIVGGHRRIFHSYRAFDRVIRIVGIGTLNETRPKVEIPLNV
jgi:hypothetical protein